MFKCWDVGVCQICHTTFWTTNDQSILLWRGTEPPVQVDGRDDLTGEPLVQRDDDKPEAVRARLQESSTMIVTDCEWFMKNIEPNWKKNPDARENRLGGVIHSQFIWGIWQPDLALVTVLQGHGGIEVNLTLIQGIWWLNVWKKCCLVTGKGLPVFIWWKRPSRPCCKGGAWNTEIFSVMKLETWNFIGSNSDRIEDLMPFMRRALMFYLFWMKDAVHGFLGISSNHTKISRDPHDSEVVEAFHGSQAELSHDSGTLLTESCRGNLSHQSMVLPCAPTSEGL